MGGFVTYGVYIANKAINNTRQGIKPQTTTIPTPQATPMQTLQVSVMTPESNIVIDHPDIEINGITRPNVILVIMTEDDNFFVKSDQDGNFNKKIILNENANTIQIVAIDKKQVSITKTINIVYNKNKDTNENK